MIKISKIFLIIILSLLLCSSIVLATDVNMNLAPNDVTEDITDGTADTTTEDTNSLSTATDDIGGVAAPSGVSSIAQENMSFSNILNILIITVGVVLILLAIAILIRLKS